MSAPPQIVRYYLRCLPHAFDVEESASITLCAPDALLADVAREMQSRGTGMALVVEDRMVIGAVTLADALTVLTTEDDRGSGVEPRVLWPSEIRKRCFGNHEGLRRLVERVERMADAAESGDVEDGERFRGELRRLARCFIAHIDVEEGLLAPALAESGCFGAERRDALARGHRRCRRIVGDAMAKLDAVPRPALAATARQLGEFMRMCMAKQEKELLVEEALSDDPICVDVFTG